MSTDGTDQPRESDPTLPPQYNDPSGSQPAHPQQGDQHITFRKPSTDQLGPYNHPRYDQQFYQEPTPAAYRPPPNRGPLIIGISVFVVVALAVLSVVLIVHRNGTDDVAQTPPTTEPVTSASAPSSSPSAPSSASTTASPSSTSSPTSVEQITVTPVISGWQGVLSPREKVAYDVPPDWKVETPDTLVGFEDNNGKPLAVVHGVSTYRDDACPSVSGSYRGHVGFKTTGDADPTAVSREVVELFARGAALGDDGKSAPISAISVTDGIVDQGTIAAKIARVTIKFSDTSKCGAPSMSVYAVAFRTSSTTTATFVAYVDQGVSDALPLTTLSKIFTTLRPYVR